LTKKSDLSSEHARLLDVADKRLNPSLTDPNFLVLQSRTIIFKKWIHQLGKKGLRILDVGGRYQPYRPLFEDRIAQYIAVDVRHTGLVDVVGNCEYLPFAANTFDLVIATQVFDYFLRPHLAAEHIHRALRAGGTMLMSVAAFAPRFSDEEHWRLTPAGIRSTLSLFKRVEIVPETSSIGGLVRTLNVGLHSYTHFRPVRKAFELTICPLLNGLGLGLERLKLSKNDLFTPNYSVLAQK
jgi:SAM-dependent methyltransferase